eukprot:TRINITY_DN41904_c0_g1_i1.p1 TRINITY_DN41904_c0_g1~~TRINITY_DN41904_c0_g1_i1.p1  ORF type:complete len:842 (-),score=69.67 TRINITY_DN41904_c0_g1_i1:98-2623(-)
MGSLQLLGFHFETWCVWLILGVNASCLALYLAVMARRAWLALPSSDIAAVTAATWKSSLARFWQCWTSSGSESRWDAKVRQLAEETRVQRGALFCRISVHILAMLAIMSMVWFQYYDITKWHDLERAKWELNQSTFVELTLGFVTCSYGWLLPGYMTSRTLDGMHCLVLFRLCWQAAASESVYNMIGNATVPVLLRVLGALIVGTPKITLLLNALCSITKLWRFAVLFFALSLEEQDFVMSMWSNLSTMVVHEVFLCASTWSVSALVKRWNETTVRANLKAKASTTNEATINSMLVVLCDVVVTLGDDLTFSGASIQMAQFLLRQPLNNSYDGVSFLDLVDEEDRPRVREQITSSLIGHGTTLSLSTRLLDGHGSYVMVQMYCTCFLDIYDCRAYVIGILEIRDSEHSRRQDTNALQFPGLEHDALNGVRGSGALHSVSEADSFRTADASSAEAVPLVTENAKLEIWIDIADERLPVVETSVLMRAITGPSSDDSVSFLGWLRSSKADAVVNLLAEAFYRFSANPVDAFATAELGKIALRPPHAMRAGLEYVADVTADLANSLQLTATGKSLVCLRSTDVGIRKMHVRGHSTSRQERRAASSNRCTTGLLATNSAWSFRRPPSLRAASSARHGAGTAGTAASEPQECCPPEDSDAKVVQLGGENANFEIWLDTGTNPFMIQEASTMVKALAGTLSGRPVCFLDWLRKPKVTEFVNTVAVAIEQFREGPWVQSSRLFLGEVALRPPQAIAAHVEYIADMTLDIARSTDVTEGGKVMVCLHSKNVQMRRLPSPSELRTQRSNESSEQSATSSVGQSPAASSGTCRAPLPAPPSVRAVVPTLEL